MSFGVGDMGFLSKSLSDNCKAKVVVSEQKKLTLAFMLEKVHCNWVRIIR